MPHALMPRPVNTLDLLYLPAAVVTAPWWARKSRSGWRERLGRIEPLPPETPGRAPPPRPPRLRDHRRALGALLPRLLPFPPVLRARLRPPGLRRGPGFAVRRAVRGDGRPRRPRPRHRLDEVGRRARTRPRRG